MFEGEPPDRHTHMVHSMLLTVGIMGMIGAAIVAATVMFAMPPAITMVSAAVCAAIGAGVVIIICAVFAAMPAEP